MLIFNVSRETISRMAGIYVHIPFCRTRCSYCDFYKDTNISFKREFINALKKEILFRQSFLNHSEITTLYFGGGTPSVLNLDEFNEIYFELNRCFDLSKLMEFTIELNPDDVTDAYLKGLVDIGVNRISYGVQSFHDKYLQLVQRRHTSQQALDAVRLAQSVGIDNISIDLIYGLPGLSLEEWREDVNQFLNLNVPHLSAYHLIFEKGTLMTSQLKKGLFTEATEDESKEQFTLLQNSLLQNGFEHYEISNFSLPGKSSKHNSSYWNGDNYLGLGSSADSFDGKRRYWNIANVKKYASFLQNEDSDFFDCELLTENDLYNEFVMLGLRTQKGINQCDVSNKLSPFYQNYFHKMIKLKLDSGEIQFQNNHYSISEKLFLISDKIISDLFYVE